MQRLVCCLITAVALVMTAAEKANADPASADLTPACCIPDFNGSGRVDLFDLDILGFNYGSSGTSFYQGDANGDGVTDLFDLDCFGLQFGSRVDIDLGSGAATTSPATAAVEAPEPSTALMLLASIVFVARRSARFPR